jgi:hypothetical protein
MNRVLALLAGSFPVGYYAPAYTPKQAITSKGYGADKEAAGPNPNIIIFARELSEPLAALAGQVDGLARDKTAELDSFVVLLAEERDGAAKLKELAENHKLENTTLSIEPADRVRAFRVSRQNDVTVMVCSNGVSRGFYTFKLADFDQKYGAKLLADLNKVVQDWKARDR